MHFTDLLIHIARQYGPILELRAVMRRERRLILERNIFLAAALLFFIAVAAFALQNTNTTLFPGMSIIAGFGTKAWGFFLIIFAVGFTFNALEAMYRSYYFSTLDHILKETESPHEAPVAWEVAVIAHSTPSGDITGGFLDSGFGQEVLYRSGINEETFAHFVGSRASTLTAETFVVDRDGGVTLETYVRSLVKHDEALRQFLADHKVSTEQFVRAARWVSTIDRNERLKARWWSRDNLGRIPGIGKTWGYGQTYLLTKYGHELTEDHVWSGALMARHAEDDEVEEIEKVLARARQSNALVLGDDLIAVRQKVAQLYHKIREGFALPPLEAKRVFFIDLETLLVAHADKGALEAALDALFVQAITAGNIIIYVEDLAAACASAKTTGVDLIDRLLPYLTSDKIQFIAAATPESYHRTLQRDNRILQVCDVVHMHPVSDTALLDILAQRALAIEMRTGIVYTIPALEAVADMADRYFPMGVMPDKAFDLLEELVPAALSFGTNQVVGTNVETLVARKTGIPVGTPSEGEREKLLTLEDFLHRRVVGQERAVSAVARALRRSRAGITDHDRPMGSFLFLGPTGVGKTETAKALAEALFNDEEAMARLDMSEFQGPDALARLIGSEGTGAPGRLATLIREKPYGVLLLDEFEKSDREVHNLFLQVIDEGYFTDAAGKTVNARNLVIIATSNAGADLFWDTEGVTQDADGFKRKVVDTIIDRALFKPEFLNRFDDIIIFDVLTKEHIRTIAGIQLKELQERLEHSQQIAVTFSDDLVAHVAAVGYDPQFGGRPMRRVIKDEVEQAVADKILAGAVRSGSNLTLTLQDLASSKRA